MDRHPSQFTSLKEVYNEIPAQQDLVSYPFTNLVVNLGAETGAHNDPDDLLLCAVIPFGNWEGGELCLFQPGLVLELSPGDIAVFPSDKITHFNMPMEGLRGSIVLSTDACML